MNDTTISPDEVSKEEAIEQLKEVGRTIHQDVQDGEVPSIDTPKDTRSNIVFDEDSKVWVYGDDEKTVSANSVGDAQKLMKVVYTLSFIIEQLEQGKSSTLREIYYLSESFDHKKAKFDKQDESNDIIELLERTSLITREDMNIRPEESGATIIGPLMIREQTRRGERMINCQEDVGEGGYQIPSNPESLEFVESDADFVLAVETGGMRDRLVENGFDEEYNALIVHLKGQPSRSTRRVINRINNELGLPVGIFTDCDPWSFRIFSSVSYGSIKSAHLSEYLATPDAEYIGIRAQDIEKYDLPTDELSDADINALESLQDDPRFTDDFWQDQIELQLDIEKKAEQQSLASQGLDFVTDEYLPERLEEMGYINNS